MRSQPLWIVGAPRSGTTFLAAALNRHPMITLSNEARLGVLLKQFIEIDCSRPDLLHPGHRAQFRSFIERRAGALIEDYYREELGVATPIWGDKHPPCADPAVLSGRRGSKPHLPLSGSALRMMQKILPQSKFIHIWREPEDVAHSLLGKGWVASLADGVDIWRQYVTEIDGFFAEIDRASRLVIAYSDLIEEPEDTVAAIVRFLDIPDPTPLTAFLESERLAPTPFSGPVSDLVENYRTRMPLRLVHNGVPTARPQPAHAGE